MSDNFAKHHLQDGEVDTMIPFSNTETGTPPGFRQISKESVSFQALVNTLVHQGVCSEEALIAEEEKLRTGFHATAEPGFNPVHIKRNGGHHHQSAQHSSLRKWASKRRWARQLGTALFGWKWRKVKKES